MRAAMKLIFGDDALFNAFMAGRCDAAAHGHLLDARMARRDGKRSIATIDVRFARTKHHEKLYHLRRLRAAMEATL